MSVIMVKADVEKGVIYLAGWKELNAAKAFQEKANAYFYIPFKNGRVELANVGSYNQYTFIQNIRKVANWLNVDVDGSVDELYERFKREHNEKRERRIAELIAEERQKHQGEGCGYCRDCVCVGDGDYECAYSGDELNSKIADDYDPVKGVHYSFADKPMPTSKCKYLTEEYLRESVKSLWQYPEEWGGVY